MKRSRPRSLISPQGVFISVGVFISSLARVNPHRYTRRGTPRQRASSFGHVVPARGGRPTIIRREEGVPRRELESVGGSRRDTGFYSLFFLISSLFFNAGGETPPLQAGRRGAAPYLLNS